MGVYEKIIAREPSNIEALIGLGRLQVEQGQVEAGAKALRRVVALQPGHMLGQALLGTALARIGHLPEALACFERAAAAGNAPPLVLLHMADVLSALGRPAAALATFDRLLAANPGNFIAWHNRGLVLETLGRDVEAAESFGRALALRPGVPESHFSLGNVLYNLERYEEAEEHHRRTVAAWPTFARGHANLGNTLFKLKRWDEALQSLRRAVALDARQPDVAKLHVGIATALRHLQREPESLASLEAALAIDPDNAHAFTKKAYTLHTLGRIDEARKLTERAIGLEPNEPTHYTVLAQTKRFAAGDPLIAKMEDLSAKLDHQPDKTRADFLSALGKAYDDIGEFDRAFPHFAASNAIKRRHIDYDANRELAGMALIAEIFTPALMQNKAGLGHPSDRPIFVLGMPRSGTTLMEQIISSHPLVFGAGEQMAFQDAVTAAVRPGQPGYPRMVPPMAAPELTALAADYLARLAVIRPDDRRFTDKMPGNHTFVGLIHLSLPNAKIVHVHRDPIDNCLSIFSTNFATPPAFACDLDELGHYYRAYERVMENWRKVLPDGVMLDVRYEDVVDDIEGQARRLIAFCGLDWDDACLEFHKKSGTVRTASAYQVRQPLYSRSVGRWRGYEKHLEPLREALAS